MNRRQITDEAHIVATEESETMDDNTNTNHANSASTSALNEQDTDTLTSNHAGIDESATDEAHIVET